MTIDDAIQHARERAITQREEMCYECAEEHEQLADWLEELKELRKFKQQVDIIRKEKTMARFNCNDCVMFGTDACRFGINHRDYSGYCDDMLVEQDHAYNKAIDDLSKKLIDYVYDKDFMSDDVIRAIAGQLKEEKNDQ